MEHASTNPRPVTYIEDLLQTYQEQTYPNWMSSCNGEVFDYAKYAVVKHNGELWMSTESANSTEPGKGSTWRKWEDVLKGGQGSFTDVLVTGKLGFSQCDTVYQEGAKFEPVYLSSPSGKIITADASLYPNESVLFQAYTKFVTVDSAVICTISSATANWFDYAINCTVSDGVFEVMLTNRGNSILKESISINYKIIN